MDQYSVIYEGGERTAIFKNTPREPAMVEERAVCRVIQTLFAQLQMIFLIDSHIITIFLVKSCDYNCNSRLTFPVFRYKSVLRDKLVGRTNLYAPTGMYCYHVRPVHGFLLQFCLPTHMLPLDIVCHTICSGRCLQPMSRSLLKVKGQIPHHMAFICFNQGSGRCLHVAPT